MPIFVYICTVGHETEFFKYRKDEKEPDSCEHLVTHKQKHTTGREETFTCGLPLERRVGGTSWKYTRGKNPNWPPTESNPADEVPRKGETIG